MTNNAKRSIILFSVLIVLALAALVSWASFRPDLLKPVYDVTIRVMHSDGVETTFQLATTAETLYEAQAELDLIQCQEPEDEEEGSLSVVAVDGEMAYESQNQYWLWDRNGSLSYYGITEQPIADDDVFDFYIYTYEW